MRQKEHNQAMSTAQKKAVANHRTRLRRKGIVRVEVQAPEGDAPLIRQLARTLREDSRKSVELRKQLHTIVGSPEKVGLKALLAAAPLDGIDLSRSEDPPRDVDL